MRQVFSLLRPYGPGLPAALAALALLPLTAMAAEEAPAQALYNRLQSLSASERQTALVEGAKKEGKVVWYTTDSPRATQVLIKAFATKYPFIDAQFIRGKSRTILDRIVTEYRAGRHLFDIAKTSTETFNLYPPEVFATYRSPAKDTIPASMKSDRWASLFTFVRAIGWNTDMLKAEEVPKTWEELLDPKWKGKILFDHSSLPEVTILYNKWGREKTAEYLGKLGKSGNLALRRGRTVLTQLMAAGEAPLAVTVYPYNVEDMKKKGAPLDWGLLDMTPGLLQPSSISSNAANPHAAALLYDFLLGEGQEVYAKMGRVPASPKVDASKSKSAKVTSDPRLVLISVDTEREANKTSVDDAMKLLDEKILDQAFKK